MMKEVEQQAGSAGPREPEKMTATDREVVELFVACLRRQIAAEASLVVTPAKAGVQEPKSSAVSLDSCLRGNDQ